MRKILVKSVKTFNFNCVLSKVLSSSNDFCASLYQTVFATLDISAGNMSTFFSLEILQCSYFTNFSTKTVRNEFIKRAVIFAPYYCV